MNELQPDDAFDVIVVGSGAAGLTAAFTAAVLGLEVAVLEKCAVLGGTTAISGGGVWIPNNHLERDAGIHDSKERALEYMRQCVGSRLNEVLANVFLDAGPRMLEFLQAEGDVRFSYAVGRPDYRPALAGAASEGRTIHPLPYDGRKLGVEIVRLRPPSPQLTFLGMMIKPGPELKHFLNCLRSLESMRFVGRKLARHFLDLARHGRAMELSNGNALVARLMRSCLDRGVRLYTQASATRLLADERGIQGVEVSAHGARVEVKARRGVVLASGGFAHDATRQRHLFSHVRAGKAHRSPGTEGVTGDGLNMAEAVAAAIESELSQPACWAPVSSVPVKDGTTAVIPHLIDRQKPGFIAVSRKGTRFTNEALSYHDFGTAMIAACADAPSVEAFLIADHRALRRYGMGAVKPAPTPYGHHLRTGYLISAPTVRDLALAAGIDADALVATVIAFNDAAVMGTDPQFDKGSSIYDRYNGDPTHTPNPCIAPLDTAPFYAVRLELGELGTLAGLRIDDRARVLDQSGKPIAGLYAAGNDAASILGGDYVSGGSTLGPGMVFGYLAGRDLAEAG